MQHALWLLFLSGLAACGAPAGKDERFFASGSSQITTPCNCDDPAPEVPPADGEDKEEDEAGSLAESQTKGEEASVSFEAP